MSFLEEANEGALVTPALLPLPQWVPFFRRNAQPKERLEFLGLETCCSAEHDLKAMTQVWTLEALIVLIN